MLRKRIERKIKDVFGEDQFGLRNWDGKSIKKNLGCR
jgi:hypothetical protein